MDAPLLTIKLFLEAFGTFILSASISLSTKYEGNNQQIVYALYFTGVFTAYYVAKAVSGAHLNPSTTAAVYLVKLEKTEKTNKTKKYLLYAVWQLIGAAAGCFVSAYLNKGNIFAFKINAKTTFFNAFVVEMLCSFLSNYLFLCLNDEVANLANKTLVSSFVQTISFCFLSNVSLNVSGGLFNPALGSAHCVSRFFITLDKDENKYLLIYVVSPFLGAFLAGKAYLLYFQKFFRAKHKNTLS